MQPSRVMERLHVQSGGDGSMPRDRDYAANTAATKTDRCVRSNTIDMKTATPPAKAPVQDMSELPRWAQELIRSGLLTCKKCGYKWRPRDPSKPPMKCSNQKCQTMDWK
jgi:hypothetical protein